ncbi:hypothetical protein BTM432_07490 [Helicobacter pylori]
MEKILAFFIPSFFISSFSGGGGVTYKAYPNQRASPCQCSKYPYGKQGEIGAI